MRPKKRKNNTFFSTFHLKNWPVDIQPKAIKSNGVVYSYGKKTRSQP